MVRNQGVELNPDESTRLLLNAIEQTEKERNANLTLGDLWKSKAHYQAEYLGESPNRSLGESAGYEKTAQNLFVEQAYFKNLYNTSQERCVQHSDCPEGFDCVGGFCTLTEDSGLVDQGSCRLEMPNPDLTETCTDENGCSYITCGTDVDGKPNCCGGKVYTKRVIRGRDEYNEPIYGEPEYSCDAPDEWDGDCDVQVDQYLKAYGELPDWDSAGQACDDCQICKLSAPINGKPECVDWNTLTTFEDPPCFCEGQENQCADQEGPCFSCDPSTGSCKEDCADCIDTCDIEFFCPCDYNPERTKFTVTGRTNPCDGPSCYDYVRNEKQLICQAEFPCGPERVDFIPCTVGCEPVQFEEVSCPDANCFDPDFLNNNCPDGKVCHYIDQYLTVGEDGLLTGKGDVFINVCDIIENCGCAAEGPQYEHYTKCQEPCQECRSWRTDKPAKPGDFLGNQDFGICRGKEECAPPEDPEMKEYKLFYALDYWQVFEASSGYCGPWWYRDTTTVYTRRYFDWTVQSAKRPIMEFKPRSDVRQDIGCNYDEKICWPYSDFCCPGDQELNPPVIFTLTLFNEEGVGTSEPYYFTFGDTRVGCAAAYPETRRQLWDPDGGPWGAYLPEEMPDNPGRIGAQYTDYPEWWGT